jgi:segregation and condensation protein B
MDELNEQQAPSEAPEPETVEALDLLGATEQPANTEEAERAELKAVLEAVVYVLNEPMPAVQIAQALDRDPELVEQVLRDLAEESNRADRGIFIREVAGGYQMASKPEHHEVLRQFVRNLKQPLKLSQAALETLAVIAYKQPITLPEILEIRGVQGGGVLKTLIDRKLVTTAGRKAVIGKPMMYKTTKDFLTQFGLKDVSELPSLKEFEEIRRQSMAEDELTPAEPAAEMAPVESAEASQPAEDAADTSAAPAVESDEEPAAESAAEPDAPPEPPADEEPRSDG